MCLSKGLSYFLWCCFCRAASDNCPWRISLLCLSISPSIRAKAWEPMKERSTPKPSSSSSWLSVIKQLSIAYGYLSIWLFYVLLAANPLGMDHLLMCSPLPHQIFLRGKKKPKTKVFFGRWRASQGNATIWAVQLGLLHICTTVPQSVIGKIFRVCFY